MQASDVAEWDARARNEWTYQADGAKTPEENKWRSYAADVLADRPWSGNCDALGSTVLDLLCRAGLEPSKGYRLCVWASSDHSAHFVGCVEDDKGALWIVGDTFKPAYPAEAMRHTPNIYNRLSETEWRSGVPWRLDSGA